MIIPRAEHPRPQFERENWVNLNGEWNFAFDFSVSGKERQWYLHPEFSQKIQVPFCPESKLSGIGFTDFMNAVWYSRKFSIKKKQLDGRVLLHFGAVDYLCEVWINGKSVGTHKGGYASFSFDITDFVTCGENTIVVYALDMPRENPQPRGKQSAPFYSQGCFYTRTTGIWQTVWLEFVPKTYIQSVHLTTDSTNGTVTARLRVAGETMRYQLRLAASFDEAEAASCTVGVDGEYTTVQLRIEDPKLWNIGEPNLYTITYELVRDGQILDSEVPVRQILEQVVAKTGIPPFMLGLSWSSTERMSSQQADMLTTEITAIRRTITPVVERICRLWLRMHGYTCGFEVLWEDINLQDEVEDARAALYLEQARKLRLENDAAEAAAFHTRREV